jgi:hypothetical protein
MRTDAGRPAHACAAGASFELFFVLLSGLAFMVLSAIAAEGSEVLSGWALALHCVYWTLAPLWVMMTDAADMPLRVRILGLSLGLLQV